MDVAFLLAGLILVILGAGFLVDGAVSLAHRWKLSPLMVGATVMSVATTLPEIVIAVASGIKGQSGLAEGNAVGSVLCNLGFIAGAWAMVYPPGRTAPSLRVPLVGLIAVASLTILAASRNRISPGEAWGLLGVGVAYFAFTFARSVGRHNPPPSEKPDHPVEAHPMALGRVLLHFVIGCGMAMVGSHLLVDASLALAVRMGISAMLMGVTVVAIGSSLPELVTAIRSARRGMADLSLGNLAGSSIANLTLVAGASGVVSPIAISKDDAFVHFPAMAGVLMLFAFHVLWRGHLDRFAGISLVVAYGIYMVVLVAGQLFG
jgi:cation:H+ antiporter